MLTTPAGNPAPAKASIMSECVRGHSSEAFRITVLPQASGTAMARTPRMMGAFQGAIPRMTPTGSRSVNARHPGLSDGMTSPPICVVNAAASRIMPAASIKLNMAQPAVAPTSAIIARTKSSLRASSAVAAFIKSARRAFGPSVDHPGNALAARSTTKRASAGDIAAALLAGSWVSGLMRSNSIGCPLGLCCASCGLKIAI